MEIVEVLTYNDDLAMVISKTDIPLPGGGSYALEPFGRIDGIWKRLDWQSSGGGSSPSVQAAEESFESKKDDIWRKFVELRNEVEKWTYSVEEQYPGTVAFGGRKGRHKKMAGWTWQM